LSLKDWFIPNILPRGGILGIRLNAGWIISIWQCGMILVVLKDRLENWFWALVWLQVPDYWLSLGHKSGLLHNFFNNGTSKCVILYLEPLQAAKIGICNFSVLNDFAEYQSLSHVARFIVR
jgi:hypothetical protein